MRRTILFVLLMTVLCAAASCSLEQTQHQDGYESPQISAEETSVEAAAPETELLPDADLDGGEFVILVNDRSDDYRSIEFAAEEMDGSVLNDAVLHAI